MMNDIRSAAIKAFAKAQSEMGKALKSAVNPHFKAKYADLSDVVDACYPALNANGIGVMQPCGRDDGGAYVDTILLHESGVEFGSRIYLVVGKSDMQSMGSAITYARRYGLLGMAGLAPEDDDGNAATRPADPPQRPAPAIREPIHPPAQPPVVHTAVRDRLVIAISKCATKQALTKLWHDEGESLTELKNNAHPMYLQVKEVFRIAGTKASDDGHRDEGKAA